MRQLALFSTAALFALSACGSREETRPTPEPTAEESAEAVDTEPVSILRPDIEEAVEVPLEALEVTIGFPDGGAELDPNALTALAELLETRQQRETAVPIIIGGHSDAGGNDAVNLRVSQERADVVRDWLIGKGVEEARITTIAFGEQNPIEPNALPNGEPDEAGRAANRRVVVRLDVPEGAMVRPDPDATPTATPSDE